MATSLDPADSALVSFGDISALAGLTELSVAITIKINTFAINKVLAGQWTSSPNNRGFVLLTVGDEVGLGTAQAGGGVWGRKTTVLNLADGQLIRLLATWKEGEAAADAIKFWVNGTLEAQGAWFGSPTGALQDASANVTAGTESGAARTALNGQYSEFAIWGRVVPDWFAIAYGKGLSPHFYRTGGILYCPLWSIDHLINLWGREDGTNNNGTSAAHPRVYYPAQSSLIGISTPAVPAVTRIPVTLVLSQNVRDDLILKKSESDLILSSGKMDIEK